TAGRSRRTLRVTHEGIARLGWIEVVAADEALALSVSVSLLPVLPAVLMRAWHAFDLGADPRAIAKTLGPLAAGEPGLRLPGTFDAFELVVRAILGQQITVKAARTLASRFVGAFGTPLATPYAGLTRVFPAPATVAGLSVDAIASLGIIGARTRTILAVAAALAEGRLHLSPGSDPARAVSELKALPGIGEWTAQYIAMRALAARDAFPHTDYGVMKALDDKNPKRVLARGEAWRPYRAYAVMHLWRSLG
ncbi:MAG: DNA-3-methyladenine glycosylase, partial [Gammaproteobacteria bacterium]